MNERQDKQIIIKLINTSFAYALFAMVGGVFYREFTKFNGFDGRTSLSFVHTHLFLLGMVMFLVLTLFQWQVDVAAQKRFRLFYIIYNTGVLMTSVMLAVRGITQVLGTELSRGADASISGISGIGHILAGVGILLFFSILKKAVAAKK